MTKKEWERIKDAAELLGLGEKASLAEIKKAYRRLAKKYHPDIRQGARQEAEKDVMSRLTEAYRTLLDYCAGYCFPLLPGDNEQFEGEDWWFERFGHDHMWCRGSVPREDSEE